MSRLRELRLNSGFSKKKIAALSGLSAPTITYLEKYEEPQNNATTDSTIQSRVIGRPLTVKQAMALSRVFEVTPDYVLGPQAITFASSFDDSLLNLYEKCKPIYELTKEQLLEQASEQMLNHKSGLVETERFKTQRKKRSISKKLYEIVKLLVVNDIDELMLSEFKDIIESTIQSYSSAISHKKPFTIRPHFELVTSSETFYRHALKKCVTDIDNSWNINKLLYRSSDYDNLLDNLQNSHIGLPEIKKINSYIESLIHHNSENNKKDDDA